MNPCTILVDGEAFDRQEWLDSIADADPKAHARVSALKPGERVTLYMFGVCPVYRLTDKEEAEYAAESEAIRSEQASNYYAGLGL